VIKNFKCKETEKIWNGKVSRKFLQDIQNIARRKLRMIAAAEYVEVLRMPPANCLKKLKGDKRDTYSIRINDQWRICFNWHLSYAHNIEIIDYH